MHSSFKTKHNFNRRHSLNPYCRSLPSRSSPFQRSDHRAQEFDTNLQNNAQRLSRPPPTTNSYNKTSHDELLPLKLVFSRTIDMSSKRIYDNADSNVYFRRKCTEITEQCPQPPSFTDIPKKRLPLMDLKLQNTTEPSFSGDSFETFRSISSRHKSNKENSVQDLDCFEDLQFTPPRKETSTTSVQQQQKHQQQQEQQQKTKHMFDFGAETRREVNSDMQQQNASHKLMTSADFLVTSSSYRCQSPVTSSVSSPRLSNDDDNDSFKESSRLNLSPVLAETSGVVVDLSGSQISEAVCGSQYNVVEALEMFSFNESTSDRMFSPATSPPDSSLDRLLSTSLPLSEGFVSSLNNYSNANRCVSDKRLQKCHCSYQGGSACCFGGTSGQDIVNKRCNQGGRGRNYDNVRQNHVDRRLNHVEGGRNSVNSSRSYNGVERSYADRNYYNQEGSGRNSVVNSSKNYDGIGRSCLDRRFNEEGRERNHVGSTRSYDGMGQNYVDRGYNQGGRGQNSVNSTQNYDGVGMNRIERSCNQGGSGRNSVNTTRNYDGIGITNIERSYNQEGRGQNSVSSPQNYDGIGMNRIERSFNREGIAQSYVSRARNSDLQLNYLVRQCDREEMDCDESIGLLSDSFYVKDSNCETDNDCYSVSSEVVIPQHLLDSWRLSPPLLSTSNIDCQRLSPPLLSTSNIDCQQNDCRRTGIIISDNDSKDDIVVNNDGSATDNTAGDSARQEIESSRLNHASWTSKKVFTRFPILSDPDEE